MTNRESFPEPYFIRPGVCLQTGSRHIRQNKACEDVIHISRTPALWFYGLADGQSEKPRCTEGGRTSLKALETWLGQRGLEALLNYPYPDELPCVAMQQVRGAINGLVREQGGSFPDYASTLLALAVEPDTGRYMLIHLGDGCAIAVRQGEPSLLSAPQTGLAGNETWLTTSGNAVAHLRITFGSLQGKARILLMSDGAGCLCRGRNILRQARELICSGTPGEIFGYLKKAEPADDAGCIVLDIDASAREQGDPERGTH